MVSREDFQLRGEGGIEVTAVRVPVPDHTLIRVIGRGAYGEVWLAQHTTLGVYRAIKVVRRSAFEDPRPFERELDGIRRYEPLSRTHPHLVSILQVGVSEDAFFYVMELADPSSAGIPADSKNYLPASLRNVLKEHGPFTAQETVEIGYALASALAHLHDHQLVHRDVKPSNIIFVDGAVRLADIGLISRIDEARSFVGTEGYIPPQGPGNPSADCYSLGKVLYELVTGNDRMAWPEPCADLSSRADREGILELNAILHRACSPDPTQRYTDASRFLKDFDYLRTGASIRKRYARRRYLKWSSTTIAVSLLLVLAVAWLWRPHSDKVLQSKKFPSKRSTNSEANDLYDVGHAIYLRNTPKDMEQAAVLLQGAIEKDPHFALAYGALAATWCWESVGTNSHFAFIEKAKRMADRALELDEAIGDAHLALAWHAYVNSRDWIVANQEFRRAIALDPDLGQPHEWYGLFLRSMGRTNEAVRELEMAVALEPSSSVANWFLAGAYFDARQYSNAVSKYRKVMAFGELDIWKYYYMAEALYFSGDIDGYFEFCTQWELAKGTEKNEAIRKWNRFKQIFKDQSPQAYFRERLRMLLEEGVKITELRELCAYAGLREEMYQGIEYAIRQKDFTLTWDILTHPVFDPYRQEPRFQNLLKSMKLDEASVNAPFLTA